MFNKLGNKIKITIIVMTFLSLAVSCVSIYWEAKELLVSDFYDKAVNITNQNNETLRMYCDMLEEEIDMIANNSAIISTPSDNGYSTEINRMLNSVVSANENILGIAVCIIRNKSIYCTSSVSNSLTYNEMVASQIPQDFINSNEKICTIARTDGLCKYDYQKKTNGYYTYIRKIFNSKSFETMGYIILDMPMSCIFEIINNYSGFVTFTDMFVVDRNGNVFSSLNNHKDQSRYTFPKIDRPAVIYNFNYIGISNRLANSSNQIVAFVSLSMLRRQLLFIFIKNILISIFFIVLCFWGVNILEKSIMIPIEELKENIMENIMEYKHEEDS